MKTKNTFLLIELIILFLLLPSVLVFDISPFIKMGAILPGIVYVIYTAVLSKKITRKSLYFISIKSNWKIVLIRYFALVIFTTVLIYLFKNEDLFIVVKKNPLMWISIFLFYSIFSVYPQEFLYRSFFFMRYQQLFKSKYFLIAVNAVLFSLAHVGFKSILVMVLTLFGGFIFALTYHKTKSLLFTSIEHALYGSWLFTVGLGEMLAFPGPDVGVI